MKHLLFLILFFTGLTASAEYFDVGGVRYNVLSSDDKTCEVTLARYSGNIVIPSEVIYKGNTWSVTSIGESAFSDCSGLTGLTIPNSVTSIGKYAFYGCSGLTGLTIPNSVTSIGKYAFYGCSGLTGLTIPNSVTSIGNYAFSNCTALANLIIEDGIEVLTMGENLFSDCPLKSLYLGRNLSYYNQKSGNSPFHDKSTLTDVTIGSSVTSIGNYAFNGCTALENLIIKDGTDTLAVGRNGYEKGLFYDCPLKYLYLGRNLSYSTDQESGYSLFFGKSTLTEVIIGNSVTNIGDYALAYCSGLPSVIIPTSVTTIGIGAFYGCSALTDITIPNSVTSIGNGVFYGCSGLMGITIPNSVASIGDYAFYDCTALENLIMEDGTDTLAVGINGSEKGLFSDCPLKYLYLGRNLSYSEEPFNCKPTLTEVTIGNSVTGIGDNAFRDCSGLTNIVIPNSVTNIGLSALSGCSVLPDIVIPNSVITIEESTFQDCTGLTSVEIPNSVTTIEESTFQGCTGLTAVEIPNSVTTIDYLAFMDCNALTTIYSFNPIPPSIDYETFATDHYREATLYVPNESVEKYKTTGYWRLFRNIKGFDATGIDDIEIPVNRQNNTYYDLNGRKLKAPKKGINIINREKVIIK